jgi:hypothetical protein
MEAAAGAASATEAIITGCSSLAKAGNPIGTFDCGAKSTCGAVMLSGGELALCARQVICATKPQIATIAAIAVLGLFFMASSP